MSDDDNDHDEGEMEGKSGRKRKKANDNAFEPLSISSDEGDHDASDFERSTSRAVSEVTSTPTLDPDEHDSDAEMKISVSEQAAKRAKGKEGAVVGFFFRGDRKKQEPRFCKVCDSIQTKAIEEKREGIPKVAVYGPLTGNSTLVKHIRQHHPAAYQQLQDMKHIGTAKNIPMPTLDKHLAPRPAPPEPFSKDRVALASLRLIAACDVSLSAVDWPEFRNLVRVLRPSIEEKDIPNRHQMADLAIVELERIKSQIRSRFKLCHGRVSFTVNVWIDQKMTAYMGVTAHYIDSQWILQQELIGCKQLKGSHTGEKLAAVIFNMFKEFELIKKGKIGWITTDNASNNVTMLASLERLLCETGVDALSWDATEYHIRCLPHIYNLAVQDLLKALTKSPQNLDQGTEYTDDDLKDPVVALRGLISAIRFSTQRREGFAEAQGITRKLASNAAGEIQGVLQLVLDVPTRWSSTFFMLDRAIVLRKALDSMANNIDYQSSLGRFRIGQDGWKWIIRVRDILKKANDCQQLLSASSHPTLHYSIPAIERLLEQWESLQNAANGDGTEQILEAEIKKLSSYYLRMEESSSYGNAMILMPWIKMHYLNQWWKDPSPRDPTKTLADEARTQFIQTYEERYAPTVAPAPVTPITTTTESDLWGDFFHNQLSDTSAFSNEAEKYLGNPCTIPPPQGGMEALAWWKAYSSDYPYLSKMALDHLAIQGSATPVERIWSTAADTDTKKRNRLSPERFEALQFLKAEYRKARIPILTPAQQQAVSLARMDYLADMNYTWAEDTFADSEALDKVLTASEIYSCLDY